LAKLIKNEPQIALNCPAW